MPKILFWNIQRSSGNLNTLSGYNLCEDLAGLAEDPLCKPDVMVLCECSANFMDNTDICPADYKLAKPDCTQGSYADDNMLCYALLYNTKTALGCKGFLLETSHSGKKLRPALGIVTGNMTAIALHAASRSSSTGTQSSQIRRAFDGFARHPLVLRNRREPDVLLGDFNINFNSHGADGVLGAIGDHALAFSYEPRSSRHGTHRPAQSNEHESVLDWALLSRTLSGASVRVVKPIPEVKPRPNELLKLRFHGMKKSDHLPILVRW